MTPPYASLTLDGITLWHQVTGQTPRDAEGTEWVITEMTGWLDGPPVRTARSLRTAGHGAYRSPAYRDPRIISIDVVATTQGQHIRALQARIAGLCADPDQLYPLVESDPTLGTRSADVELDGEIRVAHRDGLSYSLTASLQLAAPDPRIYGPWQNAETMLPDGGTGGLAMSDPGADLSDPGADMGEAGIDGIATLVTEGTAPTGVVLEILGPAAAPSVWCPELGTRVTYLGNLGPGERLWINTGEFPALDVPARASWLNGASRDHLLVVTGGWPLVRPGGVTHWDFQVATYSADARLIVHARSAYW